METSPAREQARQFLHAQMHRYQTSQLVSIRPDEFRKNIEMFLRMNDASMEEFVDPGKQRDLSIKFHWGHNHDFGEFQLEGRMENRHIDLLAGFMERFRLSPSDIVGKKVLDIGCWTGGTSLLRWAQQWLPLKKSKNMQNCALLETRLRRGKPGGAACLAVRFHDDRAPGRV